MESVFFNLPNLHFLPLNPVTSKVSLVVLPCVICSAEVDVTDLKHGLRSGMLPLNTVCFFLQFENDIYVATSEPHGDIEAVVTRKDAMPHAKL